MKTLRLPPADGITALEGILTRRRTALAVGGQVLLVALAQPYNDYNSASPEFTSSFHPAALPINAIDALKTLYGAFRQNLRDQALSAQSSDSFASAKCQLCGLNAPTTLDHYLDKATYPEFFVLPRNLVPSCSQCNNPRSTFDADGVRRIFHLYDDDVGSLPQVLSARIKFDKGEPTVPNATLEFAMSGDERASRLLQRHWTALKLHRRATIEGRLVLRVTSTELRACRGNLAVMRRLLENRANSEETHRGANDWKVATYRAAAASSVFLELCA